MNDKNVSTEEVHAQPDSRQDQQQEQDAKSGRAVIWMYAIGIVVGLPLIYQLAKFVLARTAM